MGCFVGILFGLARSPFSIDELRHIELFEVDSVCWINLQPLVGGEWFAGLANSEMSGTIPQAPLRSTAIAITPGQILAMDHLVEHSREAD